MDSRIDVDVPLAISALRERSLCYVAEDRMTPKPKRGFQRYRTIVEELTGVSDKKLLGDLGEHFLCRKLEEVLGTTANLEPVGRHGYDVSVQGDTRRFQAKAVCDSGKTRIALPPPNKNAAWGFDIIVTIDFYPMTGIDEDPKDDPDYYVLDTEAARKLATRASNAGHRPVVQVLHWPIESVPTLGGSRRSPDMKELLSFRNNWEPVKRLSA